MPIYNKDGSVSAEEGGFMSGATATPSAGGSTLTLKGLKDARIGIDPQEEQTRKMLADRFAGGQMRAAPQVGPAPQLGSAARFTGATAGPVALATGQSEQMRARQLALLQGLQTQAQGGGPSYGGAQIQAGLGQALASKTAMAASMRGGNPALLRRDVADQSAMLSQQANQQMDQARMSEMLSAMGQAGQLGGQMRAQDFGLASAQAGMNQQLGLANAGFSQQAGLANQGYVNDFYKTNAAMGAQSAQANLMAKLQMMGMNDAQARFYVAQMLGQNQNDMAATRSYADYAQGLHNQYEDRSRSIDYANRQDLYKLAGGAAQGLSAYANASGSNDPNKK